jgi:hypothetical protein
MTPVEYFQAYWPEARARIRSRAWVLSCGRPRSRSEADRQEK